MHDLDMTEQNSTTLEDIRFVLNHPGWVGGIVPLLNQKLLQHVNTIITPADQRGEEETRSDDYHRGCIEQLQFLLYKFHARLADYDRQLMEEREQELAEDTPPSDMLHP